MKINDRVEASRLVQPGRKAAAFIRRRLTAFLAAGAVVALAATVFGLGAVGQAPRVYDGDSWLWSRNSGEMTRVSSNSGNVDLRQPLVDAQGHRLQVTQSDQYLLLHDLDTGRITSVDLSRTGFSGLLAVGVKDDIAVALNGETAAVVDRTRGLIRAVDPATLQARGEPLQLPAPLVGGAVFDDSGVLWVGLPGQGTVVGLVVEGNKITIRSTVPVAVPGHELAVSVLDKGVLAVDRSGSDLVAVIGDKPHRIGSPLPLTGALVPVRTVGSLVAVTLPAAQTVIVVPDVTKGNNVRQVPLRKKNGTEVAVPFAGRIYVPDNDTHTVSVFDADGKAAGTVTVPGAEGDLELEVREKHLFVNAPDSAVASIIEDHGVVRIIDKRNSDQPGSSASAPATSEPPIQGSAAPRPSIGSPANPTTPNRPSPGRSTPTRVPTDPDPTPTTKPPTATRPGAPVPVIALAGDESARLTWGTAASGGAPVTKYTVTWSGGSKTFGGTVREATVGGLTNGKSYQFRVVASNRHGDGPPALSGAVTPVDGTPPVAPGKPTATANNGTVTVTWPAVADATEYVVTPLREGVASADPEQRVHTTKTEFTGLALGKSYTFKVVAVDAEGRAGPVSPVSDAVVPTDAPIVRVTGVSSTSDAVTVRYTVNNGGIAATACTISITPNDAETTGCSGSANFTGLTANTAYTVKVTATNSKGVNSATKTISTKDSTLTGKVTCVDKASNPDPTYCTSGGGIGVFTSPRWVMNGQHHNLMPGTNITVICSSTGSDMRAYVYNNHKTSNIWLKMADGYWISWVWATLSNGDNVSAVPKC
jgi:hypothetical protein